MALHVAIMAGGASSSVMGAAAPWGTWAVQSDEDAASLATDPLVTAPGTTHVLVLAPASVGSHAQVSAATIAAVRPEISVRVENRPVSVGVMCRMVEVVANLSSGPAGVYAAIRAGLDATILGAWLPTVANLEDPAPQLKMHVQSWFMRGDGFFAVKGSPGWVAKLPVTQIEPSRRIPRPLAPESNGFSTDYECHIFGEAPESAIAALFAMGLTGRPVRREPLGDADEVWGTSHAVEFVITRAASFMPGPPAGRCSTCAEPVWGRSCSFCRTTSVTPDRYASSTQGVSE